MAFIFNGNTPRTITYNGNNVSKLVYGQDIVWLQSYLATITGNTPLTLPNATNEALNQAKIYGICTQNGTPTPTVPVDIECNNGTIKYSANMCNVNEQTALIGYYTSASGVVTADIYNWMYKDFISVKPNTTYTLTMSTPVYYVSISEYSTASDSGFVIRKAGSTGSNRTLTITTGANTNYVRFGTNIDRTVVTLEEVLAINWMLNIGNTMTYQPYVEGGIYTDGTVETINVSGKNLFNVSANPIEQGNIASATGADANSTYRCRTNGYIPVRPNTTYTLTASIDGFTSPASGGVYVYQYNEDASVWDTSGWKNPNGYTFATNATAAKLRIVFGISNTTVITPSAVSNVQLELGSSATTYEPYYNGGSATAEMLLKVGDYKDIQEIINGDITRKVGVKVLDGTETFTASSSGAMITAIPDVAIGAENVPMNTHFALETSPTSIAVGTQRFGASGTKIYSANYYMKPTTTGTVADFKTWLANQYNAGTPVIVIYPLATETTESVTSQTLTAQEGTNIISSNKGAREMEVKYYRT